MYNLETLGRFSKYKILLRDGMITMSILIINIVKKQYNTCSVESYIGHVQFKDFGSFFKIQSTTKRRYDIIINILIINIVNKQYVYRRALREESASCIFI
jgi:hypothetical protein